MGEDDSKDCVRVGLRIRPQIPREILDMCRICTFVTPGEPQVTIGGDKSFTFDYVFDTEIQQEDIYEHCVEDLIEGTFHGYNATVLAYGQTGSGKTYTMGTGFEMGLRDDQVGIIPRAIHHLFRGIQERRLTYEDPKKAPEFVITAQFMELYNEDIIDLFVAADGYKPVKGGIRIQEDPLGGINVVGATSQPVRDSDHALELLRIGALSRTTASTRMNDVSSRSHAIFTLIIKQQQKVRSEMMEKDGAEAAEDCQVLSAKFHFVDLAGSERLKRTGATGERAKESIAINCGLLALGNVISALGDKSRKVLHVPYRDSKLTRLLQDSLGGNSQTLMIACVSPSDQDFMETLNTLKYANRARNIKNRVTVNQDSSSKLIVMLRTQILKLEVELAEFRQGNSLAMLPNGNAVKGKRIIRENGECDTNDMYHENTMLNNEIGHLRLRAKVMQEANDTLQKRNAELAVNAGLARLGISADEHPEMSDLIKEYMREIEELRTKLMESEKMCEIMRKRSSTLMMSPRQMEIADISFGESAVSSLIAIAKQDVEKDKNLLKQKEEQTNVDESDESEGTEGSDESDTDTEGNSEGLSKEITELSNEITTKQKLIDQLELSQQRVNIIKASYENKLAQLQTRIRTATEERDKLMSNFSSQGTARSSDKAVRDEYERKLSALQRELKKLQAALKAHEQLVKNNTTLENKLKQLRNETTEMKRTKVRLMNRMKEEQQKHKQYDEQKNREIAKLRKETRTRDNVIRTMEATTRMKDAVLKRRNEEVIQLRKSQRNGMSRQVAGRVKAKPESVASKTTFSPKKAKNKWHELEKKINQVAMNKKAVVQMEKRMNLNLNRREVVGRNLEELKSRRARATNPRVIAELEEEMETTAATFDFAQESIAEAQRDIVALDESKDTFDGQEVGMLLQSVKNVDEARYLIEKLYNMTVNQGYVAAQKELNLEEMEARLVELQHQHDMQKVMLEHMYSRQTLDVLEYEMASLPGSSNSSANSSRSTSPSADTCNGNMSNLSLKGHKIRRRTALPEELLYPGMSDPDPQPLPQPQTYSGFKLPIARVPSAPDCRQPSAQESFKLMTSSLRLDSLKSPVAGRKVYDRQESLSPRVGRRNTVVMPTNNLLSKPGSMEQGLDASPPNSPTAHRRTLAVRDENVFSRLTSTNSSPSAQQLDTGVISQYLGKINPRASLICSHVARGHSRAVLAVDATEHLLFSASKDRTVKVWDLTTGAEITSLRGHPNNVSAVKYNESTHLCFTMSAYLVKVWDLRDSNKCIKILCSSGQTVASVPGDPKPLVRTIQFPPGETALNAMSLNDSARTLYTATGDRVRVWDLRRFECTSKLSGGHRSAVMCLAVNQVAPGEDIVVTGSKDHYIKVFEVNLDSCQPVYQPYMNLNPPHYDGIQSLALNGSLLFSGSRDMSIKKWDLSKPDVHVQNLNGAHKDWVTCLEFMPGGQKLLSGCRGGVVKIWSTDTCALLGEVKAHSETINAITTNKECIFTASNSGEVKFWKWPPQPPSMTMSLGRSFPLDS